MRETEGRLPPRIEPYDRVEARGARCKGVLAEGARQQQRRHVLAGARTRGEATHPCFASLAERLRRILGRLRPQVELAHGGQTADREQTPRRSPHAAPGLRRLRPTGKIPAVIAPPSWAVRGSFVASLRRGGLPHASPGARCDGRKVDAAAARTVRPSHRPRPPPRRLPARPAGRQEGARPRGRPGGAGASPFARLLREPSVAPPLRFSAEARPYAEGAPPSLPWASHFARSCMYSAQSLCCRGGPTASWPVAFRCE